MILFVCNLPAVHGSYRELKEFQSVLRMQGVLFTDWAANFSATINFIPWAKLSHKELLKKKYGNKYRINEEMMRKAREWPEIKKNDSTALEKLSLFLHECANTVTSLDIKGELDYAANIKTLVNKLPYNLRDKWRSKVD